ncbi:MAG TPA: YbhB/YbcL family Raf kinase inhibitor-like protein [Nitrospirales bacterium]|nr:YbhB/YbcL family Raf kinase inhibitor-like protein [Nitrospirales bacterium]
MKQYVFAVAIVLVVSISPVVSLAQIAGDWEIRVSKVIKKPPRDDSDTLKSKFVFEYRHNGGIPPKRFLVANGYSPQAFPQTLHGASLESDSFDLVFADIYEVCPSQFAVIEEENQSIGVATLRLNANIGFVPSRSPGTPFHQLIVHDWGDLYDGLGGVSVLNFGTSLESMVLSAGLMMRDLRCADATAKECVDIIATSIRAMEPTEEQIDQGIHGGQEFHACPDAGDNSPAAELPMSFTLVSSAFADNGAIPPVHVCTQRGGDNVSPTLAWGNAPNGTEVFALIVDDEGAPCGTVDNACRHWQVYNIPPDVSGFEEGQVVTDISGVTQGVNWNQTSDYTGPCPPNEHFYTFTIYALSESVSTIEEGTALTRSQFHDRFEGHILGSASLRGSFSP